MALLGEPDHLESFLSESRSKERLICTVYLYILKLYLLRNSVARTAPLPLSAGIYSPQGRAHTDVERGYSPCPFTCLKHRSALLREFTPAPFFNTDLH